MINVCHRLAWYFECPRCPRIRRSPGREIRGWHSDSSRVQAQQRNSVPVVIDIQILASPKPLSAVWTSGCGKSSHSEVCRTVWRPATMWQGKRTEVGLNPYPILQDFDTSEFPMVLPRLLVPPTLQSHSWYSPDEKMRVCLKEPPWCECKGTGRCQRLTGEYLS